MSLGPWMPPLSYYNYKYFDAVEGDVAFVVSQKELTFEERVRYPPKRYLPCRVYSSLPRYVPRERQHYANMGRLLFQHCLVAVHKDCFPMSRRISIHISEGCHQLDLNLEQFYRLQAAHKAFLSSGCSLRTMPFSIPYAVHSVALDFPGQAETFWPMSIVHTRVTFYKVTKYDKTVYYYSQDFYI